MNANDMDTGQHVELDQDLDIDLDSILHSENVSAETGAQVRDIAIDAIAKQFLEVPEVNLEMRAFLVQTTLPTLVLSLEKLLVKMSRRGFQPDETDELEPEALSAGGKKLKTSGLKRADLPASGDAAPAAEAILEDQSYQPRERFDALNWLAQHLYRNNPSFSNAHDQTSSAYIKSMGTVAGLIRKKISDLAAIREAKRVAEEKARKEEEERMRLARLARIEEKRRIFESLLSSFYKIWITSIWRKPPGQIYRHELIEEFTEVSKTNSIQADADLYRKLVGLITCLTTEQISMAMEIPEENCIFDANDPVYTLDPATVDRWDGEFFVKMLLKLLCLWSVNELTNFLRVLSSMLTSRGPALMSTFKEALYVPKFSLPELATTRDWLEELLPIVEIIKIDDPLHGEAVQRVLKDFCLGKTDPRFQSAPHDEVVPNSDDYSSIAETMYMGFVKSILGEFGPVVYRMLMSSLRNEIEEEQRLAEKRSKKSTESKGPSPTTAKADTRRQTLAQLLEITKECMRQNGLVGVPAFLKIVTAAIDNTNAGVEKAAGLQDSNIPIARIHEMLIGLRSHLGAVDKIGSEQLVDEMESAAHKDMAVVHQAMPVLLQARNTLKEAAAVTADIVPGEVVIDRMGIEQAALDKIESLMERMDLTTSSASDTFIETIAEALQKLHPGHQVAGRISLVETAITRIANDQGKLGEGDTITTNAVVESFLRTIAASPHLKRVLLGRTTKEGSGIDYQIMAMGGEMVIENAHTDAMTCEDPMVKESRPGSPHDTSSHFIGVPIATDEGSPIGVFDLLMKGINSFVPEDISFAWNAIGMLLSLLALIDNRARAVELAKSAKNYLSARCEASIELFMVEPSTHGRRPGIFRIEDAPISSVAEWESRDDVCAPHASPHLRPWTSKLSKITEESGKTESEQLFKVYSEGKTVGVPEDQDGTMYIPVKDEDGNCVVIISIKVEKATLNTAERAHEIERISPVLGTAMTKIRKSAFGESAKLSDFPLDADKIDENTRRRMMFGKVMLGTVRTDLMRIDTKALAELRSYKKPPESIHKLLKGVLYVFGKTPKEVKQWLDAVRSLTMDQVKAMTQYDPTAVQKKIRIIRAKRAVRGVTFKEQGEKYGANSPAQILHDWLVVVLELRDLAVAARRARPDIFDRPTTDPAAPEIDNEDGEIGSSNLDGLEFGEEEKRGGGEIENGSQLQHASSVIDDNQPDEAYKLRFDSDGIQVDKHSLQGAQKDDLQSKNDSQVPDQSSERVTQDQPPL